MTVEEIKKMLEDMTLCDMLDELEIIASCSNYPDAELVRALINEEIKRIS